MARVLTETIFKHGVDGETFMAKFDALQRDGDEDKFRVFFNERICAQPGDSDAKYGKFRKWLVAQLRKTEAAKLERLRANREEGFSKFILDAFDEFVASLFVERDIDADAFQQHGHRAVCKTICREYRLAKVPVTNLCHQMDYQIKTMRAEQLQQQEEECELPAMVSSNTLRFRRTIGKSTRMLELTADGQAWSKHSALPRDKGNGAELAGEHQCCG